jgi:NAD(P)-dependent dehydrogenase (short-subunit alcohol dehydrogenase family)
MSDHPGAALVTGAGRGIGRAIAQRLAEDGWRVAVNDIDEAAAIATAAEIDGALALPFDVADHAAAAAGVARAERELGPLGTLVANHAFMAMAPFETTTEADWRRHLDVNLLGTAALVELVGPAMATRESGRIVLIASEWGQTGWPEATAYAATKGGLISLTKSAARALGRRGVAVNAVAPGVTDTPQLEVDAAAAGVSREEIAARYAEAIPLGRLTRPEEIAETVAFLCGPHAHALVGQVLAPNGGSTRA